MKITKSMILESVNDILNENAGRGSIFLVFDADKNIIGAFDSLNSAKRAFANYAKSLGMTPHRGRTPIEEWPRNKIDDTRASRIRKDQERLNEIVRRPGQHPGGLPPNNLKVLLSMYRENHPDLPQDQLRRLVGMSIKELMQENDIDKEEAMDMLIQQIQSGEDFYSDAPYNEDGHFGDRLDPRDQYGQESSKVRKDIGLRLWGGRA